MATVQGYPQEKAFGSNNPYNNPFADPDHPQDQPPQYSSVPLDQPHAAGLDPLSTAALQDPAVYTLQPGNMLRSSFRIADSTNNTKYLCKIHRAVTRFTIHDGDDGNSTTRMTAVFHTFHEKKLYLGDPKEDPNCPVAEFKRAAWLYAKYHTVIIPTTGRELIWTKVVGEHGLTKFGSSGRVLKDQKTGEDLAVWYYDAMKVYGSGSHGRFKFLKPLTKEEEMSSLLVLFGSLCYGGYINCIGATY